MRHLIVSAEVGEFAFAMNGKITCEIYFYYRTHGGKKRKRCVEVVNVSDLIQEWEK
jgi:hypothetical protein